MSEKKPTIVVALGGNAILADDASAKGQKERLKQTVEYLIPLIQKDVHLIITHGNGIKWEIWFCSNKPVILAKTQRCL